MKTVLPKVFFAAVLALAFSFTSCSTQKSIDSVTTESDKTLSFYDYEDGYRNHYEVHFKGDRIASIYKNDKIIPEKEIKNYEDLVYDNLDEMKGPGEWKKSPYVHHFEFDSDKLKEDMKKLKKDLSEKRKSYVFEFNDSTRKEIKKKMRELGEKRKNYIFEFNDSTFKKNLEGMKDQFAKLKDLRIKVHVDTDKLSREMEELNEELDINLNENLKDLEEDIKKMTEELKEKKIKKIEINIPDIDIPETDFDIPEIEIDMKSLDEDLSGLDEEISELKFEVKKLDNFMEELRKELKKDGYLKSEDDDFSLSLSAEKMSVNDKEIPSNLHGKYKELYKKHFGEELKNDIRFEIKD